FSIAKKLMSFKKGWRKWRRTSNSLKGKKKSFKNKQPLPLKKWRVPENVKKYSDFYFKIRTNCLVYFHIQKSTPTGAPYSFIVSFCMTGFSNGFPGTS